VKHSRVLTAAALLMVLAAALLAQDKPSKKEQREEAAARSVSGTVVDAQDNPAVGAVVQLKDMRSLQVRSFIAQDGTYHFSSLKPDVDYQLTAKYNKMTSVTKTMSVFDDRKQIILNFKVDKKEKEEEGQK